MPSVPRPVTGIQAVTNTEPCLPTSADLKVILLLIEALVAVITLEAVATKGSGLKVAVTFFAVLSVREHAPVPVQSPLQPAKVLPLTGVAVSVTGAPLLKL